MGVGDKENDIQWEWETKRMIFNLLMMIAYNYSAILRSLEQTHCARLWFYMSGKLFIARFFFFFLYPPKWCNYSAGMAGAT